MSSQIARVPSLIAHSYRLGHYFALLLPLRKFHSKEQQHQQQQQQQQLHQQHATRATAEVESLGDTVCHNNNATTKIESPGRRSKKKNRNKSWLNQEQGFLAKNIIF